jgi:hypothetical protein
LSPKHKCKAGTSKNPQQLDDALPNEITFARHMRAYSRHAKLAMFNGTLIECEKRLDSDRSRVGKIANIPNP